MDHWCSFFFYQQYVTDAGAEIVDATITDKRFNSSDPEDMDNFHAILCVSINHSECNITTVMLVDELTVACECVTYKRHILFWP